MIELFKNAIPVWIYRNGMGDTSMNGISNKHQKAILPFEETKETEYQIGNEVLPVIRLKRRRIGERDYVHAEPNTPGLYMAGGTLIYSPDSRFHKIVGNGGYPIHLHDRQEK